MTKSATQPVNNTFAYLDGGWRPLTECTVPVNTHALQYGTGCFEGIRGYWSGDRINILFLREHFQRLAGNAALLMMKSPTVDEMCTIATRLVRQNEPKHNIYIRPMVYKKGLTLGPVLIDVPDGFLCYMQPLGDYLDTSKGLSVCVSSWQRLSDNSIPTRTKATGGYLNSALAKSEAVMNGYDEAVFLNDRGQVCEGSAENIFLVRGGELITPDRTADILEGITRRAILQFAKDLGIPAVERPVARTELYLADELFLVGTGCQVSWVRSVDKRVVGAGTRGPLTERLQRAYEDAVYGRNPAYASWLTPA
ncbi:MAG: branched-chain amino acid transaminase [Planctomycetes bacterium]|nr:branched-chain amino acid transaminase [Planctomycetota bacterium]